MRLITLLLKITLSIFVIFGSVFTDHSSAIAQVDCESVQSLGNSFQSQIIEQLNARVSGESYKISRRKKLRINYIEEVTFSGCQMTTRINVTLRRKIRRNAHGTVSIRANISSLNLAERSFCYDNARVIDVNLSRTLNIGEAVYRWVANKALPNSNCFNL